jgi:peptidyl-tRNA hydrolase, PTH1 family
MGGLKLIVGLGNPGIEYHLTPHNMGFMALDRLAQSCGVDFDRTETQAVTAATVIEGVQVLLAKPQTYMNLSGLSVSRLMQKHGIPVGDLIVLVDDVDLPLGRIRVRARGSAGTHNGMKSVVGSLQDDGFIRVRMGVGPEHAVRDLADYVLGRFRKADLLTVSEMLDNTVEAVRVILKEGLQKAMSRFNRQPSES